MALYTSKYEVVLTRNASVAASDLLKSLGAGTGGLRGTGLWLRLAARSDLEKAAWYWKGVGV